jgi:hypothetical protein
MKKIISIKIISLLTIAILTTALKSCREYEEDIYPEKNNVSTLSMKIVKGQQKSEQDTTSDPPIKGGTHWKPKRFIESPDAVRNANQ